MAFVVDTASTIDDSWMDHLFGDSVHTFENPQQTQPPALQGTSNDRHHNRHRPRRHRDSDGNGHAHDPPLITVEESAATFQPQLSNDEWRALRRSRENQHRADIQQIRNHMHSQTYLSMTGTHDDHARTYLADVEESAPITDLSSLTANAAFLSSGAGDGDDDDDDDRHQHHTGRDGRHHRPATSGTSAAAPVTRRAPIVHNPSSTQNRRHNIKRIFIKWPIRAVTYPFKAVWRCHQSHQVDTSRLGHDSNLPDVHPTNNDGDNHASPIGSNLTTRYNDRLMDYGDDVNWANDTVHETLEILESQADGSTQNEALNSIMEDMANYDWFGALSAASSGLDLESDDESDSLSEDDDGSVLPYHDGMTEASTHVSSVHQFSYNEASISENRDFDADFDTDFDAEFDPRLSVIYIDTWGGTSSVVSDTT